MPRFRNVASRHDGFTRGYAYEVYTGRAGWKDRADTPGIGADFKASLSKPGPWTLWIEGYGETLPRHILELLRAELALDLMLCGLASPAEVTRELLVPADTLVQMP